MDFERNNDVKKSLSVGLHSNEGLIKIISEAMKTSLVWRYHKLSKEDHPNSTSMIAEWTAPGGSYITLHESYRSWTFTEKSKFPNHYFVYDNGGVDFGNLSVDEVLISLRINFENEF